MRALHLCCSLAFLTAGALAEDFQGSTHQVPYDEDVIAYSKTAAHSPIEALQEKIDRGELRLKHDEKFGWLPAVLDVLKVPASSQTLVFSKTSLQRNFITPQTPRALYFNDDVYIGFIAGAPVMEVSAVDPKLGGIFYTLDQSPGRPRFTRDVDCLRCHGTNRTMGVPGHFVRSIGTDGTGEMDGQTEISGMDHCAPLASRWAGWYVTGKHGSMTHRGNLIGSAAVARAGTDGVENGNRTKLAGFFDETQHFSRGSDIVALMVLQHQAHMHNYITRLNYETQIMVAQYGHTRYLSKKVDAFLRYLLFTEEAPLTSPVEGNAEFATAFSAAGPRDSRGRSLRDFDLETRLFRHPCSFLIYSPAFDAMPRVILDQIYQRLWDILHGADPNPDFAKIPAEQRTAILEILLDTKPNLPESWRAAKIANE